MAIFVKESGGGLDPTNVTYSTAVLATADYISGASSKSTSIYVTEDVKVLLVCGRSNRDGSENITWTVRVNDVQVEQFTAVTGGLATDFRRYSLHAGDKITVTFSTAKGYAGPNSALVAVNKGGGVFSATPV